MNRFFEKFSGLFRILTSAVVLAMFTGMNASADGHTIEMKDGSVIQGEIISLENNSYTIRSSTLGVIKVGTHQVSRILSTSANVDSTLPGQSALITRGDTRLEAIRTGLMGNDSTMTIIRGLQHDPDVQAILRDPEIMSAIRRLDFETLGNNPKIQRLMNNTDVKKLSTIAP
ncbi:MAG: hypothetical protein ABGY96_20040 [bacterium]|nr:hypothetical protein [Gammaproteobacteria bacterium]HIL98789.1 hypothetical protein [Pseudomonadales bacterium]